MLCIFIDYKNQAEEIEMTETMSQEIRILIWEMSYTCVLHESQMVF